MLYIEKKSPPQAYLRAVAAIKGSPIWRSIQDGETKAIRDQFDRLPKSEIRKALLAEQHHICAYCMKRIWNDDEETQMVHMTIEHWFPLSQDKERALDYRNFLGVCKGGGDVAGPGRRVLCCDASKGNEADLLVNPLDKSMMQRIAYMKDGTIYCLPTDGLDVDRINSDLNEVLCLNGKTDRHGSRIDTSTELLKGRRDAYARAQKIYKDLADRKQLTSTQIKKRIQQIEQKEVYDEFEGTILFVLERKRKQLESQGK